MKKHLLFAAGVFKLRSKFDPGLGAPICQVCHQGYPIWHDLIGGQLAEVTCNHCGFSVTGVCDSHGNMTSREDTQSVLLRMQLIPLLKSWKGKEPIPRAIHDHVRTGLEPKAWKALVREMCAGGWLPEGQRFKTFTAACASAIRCHQQRCNLLTMLAALADSDSRREEHRLNSHLVRVKHKRQQIEWIQERCPWRLPEKQTGV